ncbi:hypothetical protein IKQ02_04060 [bacterium]|nr:hypothetical protein [bacterium]
MKKLVKSLCAVVALFAIALCLVACAPKDAQAAKEKMDKAGYSVVVVYDNTGKETEEGEAIANVTGTANILKGDAFTAFLFKSAKEAKAALDDDYKDKENVAVVGSWVIWGSEEAIKAFK